MQLRRDTDFAIRILFYLNETPQRPGAFSTVSEIAAHTQVPRSAAARLCRRLCEGGMLCLRRRTGSGEDAYSPVPRLTQKTLLDVVEAVESTGNLFAVFDRQTPMYRRCGPALSQVQRDVVALLSAVSLGDLLRGN